MKKGQNYYMAFLLLSIAALMALAAFSSLPVEKGKLWNVLLLLPALLMIPALAFRARDPEPAGNYPAGNTTQRTAQGAGEPSLVVRNENLPTLRIPVCNLSQNELPAYATSESAGMDLRAFLPDGPILVEPGRQAMIPTGLHIGLPPGFEAQIRPRSGLAAKNGITVLNSPGTIDADYRGEIRILLVNLSQSDFTVNNGERIAQMVIARHERAEWTPVQTLSQTGRGTGGFGHTGKN